MKNFKCKPKFIPELDPNFMPIALKNREYKRVLEAERDKVDIKIALLGPKAYLSTYQLSIFPESKERKEANIIYVERFVKSLLWIKGGYRILFAGPSYIGDYLKETYSIDGRRHWDVEFLGKVYGREIEVELVDYDKIPKSNEKSHRIGKNLRGSRIGLDLGGSSRKLSALVDGELVYSEDLPWEPKIHSDPDYHYQCILASLEAGARRLDRVDGIGISAAGIYIDNQARGASLFRQVSEEDFTRRIKNIFIDLAREIGDGKAVLEVGNDGDVAALLGGMSMEEDKILALTMGTSLGAGYIDGDGNLSGWLNELAFVPLDYNEGALVDEWSLDRGVGVSYLSQDGGIKLALEAGIDLEDENSPAEKFFKIHSLMEAGDRRARLVYENIGIYLGYSLAYYGEFYDIGKVLLLGGVLSGRAGDIIIERAEMVLREEFNDLYKKIELILPDEKMKRLGQSIAAASLPDIRGKEIGGF